MRPRYGYGLFNVDPSGEFRQKILFFYWDPEKELFQLISRHSDKTQEIVNMRKNMQLFLDSERILINGKEVRAKVEHVNIGFLASPRRPYIEFLILFRGDIVKGNNVYENYYEKEKVDYNYRVVWIFPANFRIIRAELGFPHEVIGGRILVFDVMKGAETPGYELIEFLAP